MPIAMKNTALTISIVVPCFNEENCIVPFCRRITQIFDKLPEYSPEIVFVNDGSADQTLQTLLNCQKADCRIVIVDLSRNFGKEAALTAGIYEAHGAAVIPMDVDLQDPPELIPQMLAKWREGYNVVLARRYDRTTDSWGKRITAHLFYRVHNIFSNVKIPENVGDFRLMDRQVIDALKLLPENCRFMKGIFAWLGFKSAVLDYKRPERSAGKSKFHLWKLWNFALDGITGFSTAPLRIWTYIGAFFAIMAFIYATIIFIRTVIFGVDVPGYASLLVVITFLGGLQLVGIGVLGEYLGRTYLESKRRPIYLVRKVYREECGKLSPTNQS